MQRLRWKCGSKGRSVAVIALLVAGCALAHLRPSLWETLNCLWLLLVTAVLAHWATCGERAEDRWPKLVSLIVLLVLLFPVLSPDDDWLLFSVPDEARTVVSIPDKQKHFGLSVRTNVAVATTPSPVFVLTRSFDPVPADPTGFPAGPAGHATGNHSPPVA